MADPATVHPDDAPAPLGRTLSVGRPAAGRLLLASLLGAAAVGASIGLMATSAWLISRASQHPPESVLSVAIVGVQFFGLSRGFFRYGERLVGHDAAFRLLASLRVRVYRALERLAPTGLPAFRRGDLLARLVQDVDSLQDLLLRVVPPFVSAALVGAAAVALDWWLLPGAGVVLLSVLVVGAVLVPWYTGRATARRSARLARARGELSVAVTDLIEGAPELVAFGAAGAQVDAVRAADRELVRIGSASAATSGAGLGAATFLSGLAAWATVVVGIPAVHAGRLPGVDLAVVALVPLAALELVVALPAATQALQQARRSAGRVFAVLDAPSPVPEPVRPLPLPPLSTPLVTSGLSVRYPGADRRALEGVDVRLGAGRRLAVVGPSGAGKSTLAEVLVRFLPYEGSVTLHGVELADLAGDAVRSRVGLVTQGAHLFDTTLAANLRVGRPDASDAELGLVLERVGLAPWVASLTDGLATEVGPGGRRLSGGQRQRVAIGRALLHDFEVLVLDEPGAHLEPALADALTADLLGATEGRSTLLITHRLAGLQAVDEVVVLRRGRVDERGTHQELVDAGGWYGRMWADERRLDRRDQSPWHGASASRRVQGVAEATEAGAQ